MPVRISLVDPAFEAEFEKFLNAKRGADENVAVTVAAIIASVRERGDDALFELTRRFDGFEPDAANLRIGADEIAGARAACSEDDIQALELAAERIGAFHQRQSPEDLDYRDDAGVRLGFRWRAIKAAGIGRVILAHCDDERAIDHGHALGISMFQGRYVDQVLAPGSRPRN